MRNLWPPPFLTVKLTADGREFLLHRDWLDEHQTKAMAVFLSDWGAEVLRKSSNWLLDGTFRSTLAPFAQIYIVMALSETTNTGLPCGFSLLPSKEPAAYNKMMTTIQSKVGEVGTKLENIVTDVEPALFNTLLECYPDIDYVGCQFHFRAVVWK